jgi:hypothetical protein
MFSSGRVEPQEAMRENALRTKEIAAADASTSKPASSWRELSKR